MRLSAIGLLVTLILGVLVAPHVVAAQAPAKAARSGWLRGGPETPEVRPITDAFIQARMITARFIRVLLRYTDSLCTHYMFTLQQVMPLSKTCNRLSDNLWHYSGVLPPFRIGAGPFH